jgi:hypothetical protein
MDVLAQPGGLVVKDLIQCPGRAETLFRRQGQRVVPNDLADVLAVADAKAVLHVVKRNLLDLPHHALVHMDHLPVVPRVVQAHAGRAVGIDVGLALLFFLGQLPNTLLLLMVYHLCDRHGMTSLCLIFDFIVKQK